MYLDTSIMIKLLVRETDSVFYNAQLAGQPLSSSELMWTEVLSALQHKERTQQIAPADRDRAWQLFGQWVQEKQIVLHPLDGIVLKKAAHILKHCHPAVPLRTLDAIHTAACDLSQDFPLCTTDRRMRDAADVLGIPVFPADASAQP